MAAAELLLRCALLMALAGLGAAFVFGPRKTKEHRSFALWNFNNIVHCLTGEEGWNYMDYGCYCNVYLNGVGPPVDPIDKCCKKHNECLKGVVEKGVCLQDMDVFIIPYKWRCAANMWGRKEAWCEDYAGSCGAGLCRCDVEAADCFKNTHMKPDPDSKKGCPYNIRKDIGLFFDLLNYVFDGSVFTKQRE